MYEIPLNRNAYIIRASEGINNRKKKKKEIRKIILKKITEKFPNLSKKMDIQFQEA